MKVYSGPLKFQIDCINISQDMGFLKLWFFCTFCIVVGKVCPPQYRCMDHDFKMSYFMIDMSNLFYILKTIVDLHT